MATDSTGHDFHDEALPQDGLVEHELTPRQEIGYDRDVSSLAPLPKMPEAPVVDGEPVDETVEPTSNVTPIPTVLNQVVEAVPLKEWQLDEQTKAVGRRGIAGARAALYASKAKQQDAWERQHGFRPPSRSTVR